MRALHARDALGGPRKSHKAIGSIEYFLRELDIIAALTETSESIEYIYRELCEKELRGLSTLSELPTVALSAFCLKVKRLVRLKELDFTVSILLGITHNKRVHTEFSIFPT